MFGGLIFVVFFFLLRKRISEWLCIPQSLLQINADINDQMYISMSTTVKVITSGL